MKRITPFMLFVNLHLQDVNTEMSLVMFSVFLNHSVNLKGFPNESESNCLGKDATSQKTKFIKFPQSPTS